MTAVQGTAVDIPTEDGIADAYLAHPGDERPRPAVLLYQDAFGLRPHLESMADRLAAAGYTVLVPNVFYRQGRAPVVELPEFIDHDGRPEIFEKVGPLIMGLARHPELIERDAGAYLRWLAESPLVADGPIAITGYCMGARLALYTAGAYPDRVAAAAGFHGGRLATDDPDSPHLAAEHITAELYFGHADQDPRCPRTRSSGSRTRSPRRASGTAARSIRVRGTAIRRPTPRRTTRRPTSVTGSRCSTCWTARSDRQTAFTDSMRVPTARVAVGTFRSTY